MKHLVLKLDDIGRDSNGGVFDVVAWALKNRLPISIGTIGADFHNLPASLVDLVRAASKAGFLEIWNHGHRHVRYDQVPIEAAMADLTSGHQAIVDTFGIEPAGFGFPFNQFNEAAVALVRERFPNYFIYETDFPQFKLVSPEFNAFGDGQPRASYFFERIAAGGTWDNIVLQAHPPRWSKSGFAEFDLCVKRLVEERGYVCLTGADAIASTTTGDRIHAGSSAEAKVVQGIRQLAELWEEKAAEYSPALSNFKSYFLGRFKSDTQKNWHQMRAELFPFRARRVLDFGSGLGNWSLPFWLSGECDTLVLNDVNATIVQAVADGIETLGARGGATVQSTNLLNTKDAVKGSVDLIVSGNAFNYVDPVDFFKFAQTVVAPGGRLLLMLQAPAFNRLRYRLAVDAKDRAMASEVLGSDFAMLLRREYRIYPEGVRHAYPLDDVNCLANMFDFNLLSRFAPYGESKENGEDVYECLLFKRNTNMRDAILRRQDWLDEATKTVNATFGSRAFELAGIPKEGADNHFSYYGEWAIDSRVPETARADIELVKRSIDDIRYDRPVDQAGLSRLAGGSTAIAGFAAKVGKFAASCNSRAAFFTLDRSPPRKHHGSQRQSARRKMDRVLQGFRAGP